jgi:transposase-like protein
MARSCSTCQHIKRGDIDRRLAAGEPNAKVAEDYGVSASSLYRHRTNCLGLGSANEIMKEAARGDAALALLPSAETIDGEYLALCRSIDAIVAEARQQGSLKVALTGLNSVRAILDSRARLAGHGQGGGTAVNIAVQTNVTVTFNQLVERVIKHFDHEPEFKARIAEALLEIDHEPAA